MSLIHFHRFLIVCFILFSLYFAWHLFTRWRDFSRTPDLLTAIFFAVGAVAFSFYLRTVKARRRPPQGDRG